MMSMSCLSFVTSFHFIHIQRENRKKQWFTKLPVPATSSADTWSVELTSSDVACISHCFFERLSDFLEFGPLLRHCVAWTKFLIFAELQSFQDEVAQSRSKVQSSFKLHQACINLITLCDYPHTNYTTS